MKTRLVTGLTLAIALGSAAVTTRFAAVAQDPKADASASEQPPAKATAESKALGFVAAAHKMVDYAREQKCPEALIVAAKILGTTGYQKGDIKDAQVSQPGSFDPAADASALIDEALKMPTDSPDVVKSLAKSARAEIVERKKGAIGGPKAFPGRLGGPDRVDTYFVAFRGGEPAEVIVRVEPNYADVDLYVTNDDTGEVYKDHRANDDCHVRFYPRQNGRYIIRLKNYRRDVNARYTLFTN